jgi:ATP-binding cassette, subfamily B, multidrug efflux pump
MFGNPRQLFGQDTIKPKRTGETLLRFGAYFRPYWYALILAALLVVISTWAQVTAPQLIGQLVDCYLVPATSSSFGTGGIPGSDQAQVQSSCWLAEGQTPQGFTQTVVKSALTAGGFKAPPADASQMTEADRIAGLGRMVLLLVGLYVIGAVLTGLTFYTMTWSGQHVLRTLRTRVFEHLHALHVGYYAEHEAGDLMSRITNDTETINQAISFALVNVVSGALLLVWIGYNMLSESLAFALLSMAVVPLMAVATVWFSGQARKAFRRTRKEIGNVNAELQESISAVREVQAFNRADENMEQFRTINAANRDANVKAVAFTSALAPTLEALGYVALMIVTVVGGLALLGGGTILGTAVSIGLVITFIGYVQRFNQPIQQIAVLWTNIQNAVAGGERIFGLLDEKPEIFDVPGATEMPAIEGRVVFDNVQAAYKEDEPVLCGVNFTAEPGQTIAIVGPTGAGKTTIINLIPRFYDVTGGAVLIDGIDVRNVTAVSLRKQIAIVLQDTFMFSTSVMENIRFGRPDATDEEVIAAAKLARADTFIERLSDKYHTVLGERGSGLSQGQRQLLAIARAALAEPHILILDEATSSVDTRTERLIQQALEKLLEGRTSFVIAHRLSTIRNADQVLVLKDGELIERGRFNELMAQKGFFYNLYMSQFNRDPQFQEVISGDGHKSIGSELQQTSS